jgi:hypothetical protein
VGYFLGGDYASGLELLGSAIRTWGSPSQIEKNRTLVGGEVRASFFLVTAGVGVFKPVGKPETERRTRVYFNLGLGI